MAKAKKEFRLGINALITCNGSELSNVTDVTVTLDAGEADVTTRDNDGFRAIIGGLKECSIDFEMLYLPGDSGFQAIKEAWLNSKTVQLSALTGKGGEGPSGDFSITGFSRSEPLEEAIKYSVTAKLSQWDSWISGTPGPA